jgi:hypothetical protein
VRGAWLSRRGFLRTAAATAATVAAPALAQDDPAASRGQGRHRVPRGQISIQPPREPADALDTARVGYQFLRTVRF